MTVAVVIVAAGRGRRLGSEVPKQYLPIGARCALTRSVEAFLGVDAVRWVVPVIHADDEDRCAVALRDLRDERVMAPVTGGASRAVSVRRGLESLDRHEPVAVLIHDAARPFVPRRVIEDVIAALRTSEGACAALPVVDALWRSENGAAQEPVPRDDLWRAQTPQGFLFDKIKHAHQTHDGSGADDVAVAREAGLAVQLVPGSELNYKITTEADYERALSDSRRLDAQIEVSTSLHVRDAGSEG